MNARRAHSDDRSAIEALSKVAHRKLPRLWWWEEHLGHDVFIVVEHRETVVGALLAWPDESPVAWTRLAVLDDDLDIDEWLNLTLPAILGGLRRRGAHQLAWMDYGGWAGPHLAARGFKRLADVVTLSKSDRLLPGTTATHARVRPVSDADVPAVVAVDQAAFTPHWWHSETTMRRKATTSSYFTVAELAGEVVGYVEGDFHRPAAHINRIAVHPTRQGHSIGALLLQNALSAFWRCGAGQVTLNTQVDNRRSQRLYRRFGFEPTGDVIAAWRLYV